MEGVGCSIWKTITQFWPLVVVVLGIQMLHLEGNMKQVVYVLLTILVFLMLVASTGSTKPATNTNEELNPESYLVIPT